MFSNILCEDDVGNANKTHFILNMDNGRTLRFSEKNRSTLCRRGERRGWFYNVGQTSGGVNGCIEPHFIVLMNKSRSYPIKGVSDVVPGVAYRSGPKGWIDIVVLP